MSGLSEAGRLMRFVRGLQLLQLGVGQHQVESYDCIVDVVRFGGADDRRGDTGPAGHPGERDLCPGHLPLGGNAGDLLDDQPIAGLVKVAADSSVWLRVVSWSQSRVSLPRARGLQGMTPTPRSAHSGSISRSSSRLSRL